MATAEVAIRPDRFTPARESTVSEVSSEATATSTSCSTRGMPMRARPSSTPNSSEAMQPTAVTPPNTSPGTRKSFAVVEPLAARPAAVSKKTRCIEKKKVSARSRTSFGASARTPTTVSA